jgi:WD40 repeat protein
MYFTNKLVLYASHRLLTLTAPAPLLTHFHTCNHCAHSRGELLAVAAHPQRSVYATAGGDGILREWSSAPTPRLLRKIDIASAVNSPASGLAQCCRFSPNGLLIAVGLTAAGSSTDEPSQVVIVSTMEAELRVVHRLTGPAGAATGLRFSPDGNTLAAGGTTGAVLLYDVLENFALRAQCPASDNTNNNATSAITTIDFSAGGGDFLRACSDGTACVARYIAASTGAAVEESAASAQGWCTWTAVHGREVTGVWPKQAQTGSEVTALCRSNDRALVAAAQACGTVLLHRFPCGSVGGGGKGSAAGGGGSGHNIVLTSDDNFLISVGKTDRYGYTCVIHVLQY